MFLLAYMHVGVSLCVCVGAHTHMWVPTDDRRGHRIPWSQSYKWL